MASTKPRQARPGDSTKAIRTDKPDLKKVEARNRAWDDEKKTLERLRGKSSPKLAKRTKSSASKQRTTSKTTRKTTTTVKKTRSQSKRSSSKKPASASRGDSAASGASSRAKKSRSSRADKAAEGEGKMETVAAGKATSSQTKLEVRAKTPTNRYSAPIDIINMSGQTVAYKIKTNVGNLLSVNPSCTGVLKAGQCIPVEIYVNGEFKTELTYTVLLLSIYVPSSHEGKLATAIWNDSKLLNLDTTCTALNLTFAEKTAISGPSDGAGEMGPDGKPKEPMVTMVLFEDRSFVRPMSETITVRKAQTEAATKPATPSRSGIPMLVIIIALIGIAFAVYFRMRARSGTPAPSYYRR